MGTYQLQSSQTQVLLQLRKHLEYPKELEIWNDHRKDFCSLSYSTQVNITCQDDVVTELRILGDKLDKVGFFNGFAIQNQTLSDSFSVDSLITTLTRLTSLRVLSLMSLGIWGPLPDKIHRLSSLEYLDFSSNYFFGSVPPKISTMVKLQTFRVDGNFFNETMPNWFDSLSSLTVLSLRNNKLNGKLPDLSRLNSLHLLDLSENKLDSVLPGLPNELIMVFLNNNSIWGVIPKKYGQLSQLQHLDMSFNELRGVPPAGLFSLPNLEYLNFASNKLDGSLPDHLSCGSKLKYIDMSYNFLSGGFPSCLSTDSEKRVVKLDWNCLPIDSRHQHAESYCDEKSHMYPKQSRGKKLGVLVGIILGIFVVMVLLASAAFVISRKYCCRGISEQHLLQKAIQDSSAAGFSSEFLTNARFVSQAAKLSNQGLPLCRTFSLEEIRQATGDFNNSAITGEGSFGKLYKGRLQNGTQVAIRCLPISKKYSIRNFKLRLDMLGKLRHPHLVCLLGHCIDSGGRDDFSEGKVFLVSEYVPNGSFRTYLSGNSCKRVLNWSERLAILLGVAKAVQFLHTGVIPGFFNNRLKLNNILLEENQMPKLSDYGLSIISDDINKPEVKGDGPKSWQMINFEDDVYSFGFIILEALVASSVSARKEALLLTEMASFYGQDSQRRIIDPTVQATCSEESLSIVISIMSKCISPESSRPSIEDVLWNLQYAVQVQETADGDKRYNAVSHH